MPSTKLPHSYANVFTGRPHDVVASSTVPDVRQDKRAFARARPATHQPARSDTVMRAQRLHTKHPRSQTKPIPENRRVKVTPWIKPVVKEAIERKAAQNNLSVSAVAAALLEKAVQEDIDMGYGSLITPVIEQAIRKEMQRMVHRLAWLLVRIAVDTGQIKALSTAILGRQKDVTEDLLKTIVANSSKSAKANLSQKTPEMLALMEELMAWLRTGEEEDTPHE